MKRKINPEHSNGRVPEQTQPISAMPESPNPMPSWQQLEPASLQPWESGEQSIATEAGQAPTPGEPSKTAPSEVNHSSALQATPPQAMPGEIATTAIAPRANTTLEAPEPGPKNRTWPKRLFYLLAGAGAVAAVAWSFRPAPIAVDLQTIDRGDLQVTVEAEGKTRVKDRYIVSAPVTGRLSRIDLDAGDAITTGQTLGRIDPLPYSSEVKAAQAKLQELQAQLSGVETQRPKSAALSQANAAIVAAQADQREAQAEVERARATLEQARRDRQRTQTLEQQGAITRNAREDAELLENTRTRELEAAQQRVQRAIADVAAAQEASSLLLAEQQDPDYLLQVYQAQIASAEAELANLADEASRTAITAPAGGKVLRLWQTSARYVQAGEPLLEIGDPADQELVIDLLSSDAVKVELNDPINVLHWGGEQPLTARVQAIEPSAFTEVSALGVEEQRVNVIGQFLEPVPLGDGYRVEAEIVIQEAKDVLKVPVSALFRCESDWCVFTEEANQTQRQQIRLGQRNAFEAEVLGGLAVGDRVILHPTEQIEPGKRIKDR